MASLEQMALGRFKFMVGKTGFDELEKSFEYRIVEVPLAGRRSAAQYLGEGLQKLSLKGVIYPTHAGKLGLNAIDRLREEIEKGKPLALISGRGRVYGNYYVESIREAQSAFLLGTTPQKIDFTISLVRSE